jgi:hypothetical protein
VPPRPVAVPAAQALAANPAVFHPLVLNAIEARSTIVAAAGAPTPAPPTGGQTNTAPGPPMHLAAAPQVARPPGVAAMASLSLARSDFAPVNIRSDVMEFHVQELGQRSTPQTVTSEKFKLSFDYCLVEATCDWLDGGFLYARNWYVPHTKAGEIASGTGFGAGPFEVRAVAAIFVKNLLIEANWSQDDIAILQHSVSFGPFSLVGRTIDAVNFTLSCKGIQRIATVFQSMPRLPPCSDPTMP